MLVALAIGPTSPSYDRRVRWRGLSRQTRSIAFESYGVRVLVDVPDAGSARRIEPLLPERRRSCEAADPDLSYVLRSDGAAGFDVLAGRSAICVSAELDVALAVLETQIRTAIALLAADSVFVHAGVVAYRGRAVLVPGTSFSGKTTLVAALVRAGASYLSDEYAVLDDDGLVHAYPKPLSMRAPGSHRQTETRVESIGGTQGEGTVPVGLIVVTAFRPGAEWAPKRRSAGQGALALLANTVPARERPGECLRAVRAACETALVLEGERGEAAAAAPDLLGALQGAAGAVRSPA